MKNEAFFPIKLLRKSAEKPRKTAFNFLDNIWLRYKIVKVVENIRFNPAKRPAKAERKLH